MNTMAFVGMDVHKKTISMCGKNAAGEILFEDVVASNRPALGSWAEARQCRWKGVMEATLFTGWIYDFLKPFADELVVGNPLRLKAISSGKKKSDRLDARTLADLLRCDLVPAVYMMSEELRELRRVLRYRNLLVREAVRFSNRTSGLLMEVGAEFDAKDVRGLKRFDALVNNLKDVPDSVRTLLRQSGSQRELFSRLQRQILLQLGEHPALQERVGLLRTIPAVGAVTALTWALEVGEPQRFTSTDNAVSYCGLCSGQKESAGKSQRGPISKQRNEHLQPILIEAAKLAPRYNPQLKEVYEKACQRGHKNRATLEVARKMVGYLLYVDRTRKPFHPGGTPESR
jgi:transposase